MLGAAPGDDGFDASGPEQAAVFVVVIAAVGEDLVGLLARPAGFARDRAGVEVVKQWQQLGDVVSVAAGQRDGQRDAAGVDEEVVF